MNEEPANLPDNIEVPTPTAWPMVLAFGLTLLFAGLITNFMISIAGGLTIFVAVIGLFREVFPHPRHIMIPIRGEGERAMEIKRSTRSVQHLEIGKSGHRVRVPIEMHPYSSGVIGGLAGGVVMAFLALIYGLMFQGSIWYPINLLAAAGVPSLATASLEVLRAFSMTGLLVGIVVHISMSIMVGLLYTVLLPMLPARRAWFLGGIITPLIWSAVLYPVMGIIDPALAGRVDWPWFIICQVAFGLVGGFVIFKLGRVETMQSWSVAQKLGVEAQRKPESTEGPKS